MSVQNRCQGSRESSSTVFQPSSYITRALGVSRGFAEDCRGRVEGCDREHLCYIPHSRVLAHRQHLTTTFVPVATVRGVCEPPAQHGIATRFRAAQQRGPTNIGADFGARAVRTAFIRARFLRFFFVEVLGRSSGSSCRGEVRRMAAVVRKRAKFRNEPPIAIGSAHLRFHGGGREDTPRAAPYTCHWGACGHARKGRGIMVLLAWLLRIVGTLIRHDVVRVIPTLHRK